jgi:hypothetical protein
MTANTSNTRTFPTLARSVRLKCLDCVAGDSAEVRRCVCFNCALWPHRLGFDPDLLTPGSTAARRWVKAAREASEAANVLGTAPKSIPDHPLLDQNAEGETQ